MPTPHSNPEPTVPPAPAKRNSAWAWVLGTWCAVGFCLYFCPPGSILGICSTSTLFLASALMWQPRIFAVPSPLPLKALTGLLVCALYLLSALAAAHFFSMPGLVPFADPAALFVLSVTLVPVCEEAFFRGALQPTLAKFSQIPEWGVLYLSALIFWLFHIPLEPAAWTFSWQQGGLPFAPGPFFLGLACAYLRKRDGHIWGAVVLHGCANACGVLWEPLLTYLGAWSWFYR